MYFLRGSLPWQGLKANTKEQKIERIMENKISISTEVLCKDYPGRVLSFFSVFVFFLISCSYIIYFYYYMLIYNFLSVLP